MRPATLAEIKRTIKRSVESFLGGQPLPINVRVDDVRVIAPGHIQMRMTDLSGIHGVTVKGKVTI